MEQALIAALGALGTATTGLAGGIAYRLRSNHRTGPQLMMELRDIKELMRDQLAVSQETLVAGRGSHEILVKLEERTRGNHDILVKLEERSR